jgi:ABC-type transport system involved in multi-copper enzyme maturation permease subunit
MELLRQPVFLLLMTSSVVFSLFLASVPYFGFGDDPKLVKDSVLAIMLLSGLLGSVLCASAALTREIHAGTALAVLAKPVSRGQFLLAKYVGIALALSILTYVNLLGALLASRMGYDAYGDTDWIALGIFYGFLVVGYALGGFSNYFLRRPFVSDAVFSVALTSTLAFILINFIGKEGELQRFGVGLDPRIVPASVLILFAVWVLAGLALLCSTRLELMPTLAVCSALFLLGLISDYLYTQAAKGAGHAPWWSSALYTVLPNWQLFWMADALEEGKNIPWTYVATALGYALAYIGAALAVSLSLFEDRELN